MAPLCRNSRFANLLVKLSVVESIDEMKKTSEAQSHCLDGDIKQVAGENVGAALAFLRAHIADAVATKEHLSSLNDEQRDILIAVLHDWISSDVVTEVLPSSILPHQIWEFLFCLEPEAVTSCYIQINDLLEDNKFYQIVDCCTAILKQCPLDTVPLLLQRGLGLALIGGREKEAIADYLRAFLKDKEATFNIINNQQHHHVAKIKLLMNQCVYSKAPPRGDMKAFKQWVALTIDCCRFLLILEPDNFILKMTFIQRLMDAHKRDRAMAFLDEILVQLQKQANLDVEKATEVYLRKAANHFAKQDTTSALSDTAAGLNVRADFRKLASDSPSFDDEIDFLTQNNETTAGIAACVFEHASKSVHEVASLLQQSANKMIQGVRVRSAVKLENVRVCIDYYRAVLALQPDNKDTIYHLALCYAKLGKYTLSIALAERLLQTPNTPTNPQVLALRASCYRELGNKVGAKKDYDALLLDNPREVTFLCERAMVNIENDDVPSAVDDLLIAFKINQKEVVHYMNKEALVQRTRARQALFDFAKNKLRQSAERDVVYDDSDDDKASSTVLGISQLLTKLNPADVACHILLAHALFHSGCRNDAETKLKSMVREKNSGLDDHVIKLHLGIIKIFTNRRDEGMMDMIDILVKKSERVFTSILRDIPLLERARLSEEAHRFGIKLLERDKCEETVRKCSKSFTIAILFCRESDLVLEGRHNGTGFHRSYLARAECMAHLGDQRAAILDFSAAIEIYPQCVDGLCGRAFMRLALGHETECVNDVTIACGIDTDNVLTHIQALPEEARKLLLFWIDHRVVALLLNYGYRSNDRVNTGGSASTISIYDETMFKPSELGSSIPPSRDGALSNTNKGDVKQTKSLHKSETEMMGLISNDSDKPLPKGLPSPDSATSLPSTSSSFPIYDEVFNSSDKAELLEKAQCLVQLLVTVDECNASWRSMFADVLIVKGDYEEALQHLQVVNELNPSDVTATARAGLINVKINRYKTACKLLSNLTNLDRSGIKHVVKALDASRRRRLCEESFHYAEALNRDGKYAAARDCHSLSLLADSYMKLENQRLRSRCHAKLGDTTKAIADISEVIKELARQPLAHDYCYRASLYLIESKEFQACRDYTKGINIDKEQAVSLIRVRPGRETLCDVFYKQASVSFERRNYDECGSMCDVALLIDSTNIELRKLRARAKREVSKCCIQ